LSFVSCGTRSSPAIDSFVSYLLVGAKPHHIYIGATISADPFARLAQHNGLRSGGTTRLAKGRPWAVAAWVSGFPTWKHALKFERAWQRGYAAACMRDAARTGESVQGVVGKLRILCALLITPTWYWHVLHVHLVRGKLHKGFCAQREAVLATRGHAHLTWWDL